MYPKRECPACLTLRGIGWFRTSRRRADGRLVYRYPPAAPCSACRKTADRERHVRRKLAGLTDPSEPRTVPDVGPGLSPRPPLS